MPRNALLGREAWMAGWPTPAKQNGDRGGQDATERIAGGHAVNLQDATTLAGWPTAQARDHFPAHSPEYIAAKKALGHGMANLNDLVQLAGWLTCRASDAEKNMRTAEGSLSEINRKGSPQDLCMAAAICGPARLTVTGELLTGSDAGMAAGGQLHPAHSLWLQLGPFATAWARCAERVTLSTSRKRKASSKPSSE